MTKKLNESIHKIANLETKVKRFEQEKHNNSAINFNYGLNKSEIYYDKGNVTAYQMGENLV